MLPSGLPEVVGDAESLARFLRSSSYFNATNVKPVAFLPNPKEAMTTSVFRHEAEPRDRLLQIGREQIGSTANVHGAAICKAAVVREARLDVIPDEPPLLHANIVGWPVNAADERLQKAAQIERALVLVSKCTLVRFESKAP
ncbi:MAG TPA: hypothetical protein VN380_01840 [Thermoanaerobaculia bacterium]|jgi:hypothetical protein|nr:hypothetical protein [Thermoanaerobaculia bacterium]